MKIDQASVPSGVIVEARDEGKKDITFRFSLDDKKVIGSKGDPLRWGARLARFLRANEVYEASVDLGGLDAQAVATGAALADYRFGKYSTEERKEISLHLLGSGLEDALRVAGHVVQAVELARDLGNEPAISVPPELFARRAREALSGLPVEVSVLQYEELKAKGFGGLVAVGKGSSNPPAMLVMRYEGGNDRPRAVVGKGVVFDAGGLNLKTSSGIRNMYMDKSGAADTVGIMLGLAKLGVKRNVIGVAPLVENIPSGNAVRPGDIIRTYSGKTVEVANTDAEGRVILADAIWYAKELGASEIVDLATLTGAQVVALGNKVAAVMGNDDSLIQSLLQSGKRTQDLLWQLPLFEFYDELVKSDRADLKNVSETGEAGSEVGGAFLKPFAEGVPWAHVDLAGPAMLDKDWEWATKGATGFGVRLMLDHLGS
ncbi:MAG: leucyl aminopeptidase [TACK group archaeon]|nr:leucyl aminopeptidase [TACK group archaeon]